LITQYFRYQYSVTQKTTKPFVHLRNSNKQHLILANFYVNNVSSIANQIVKFQLNLRTQTIVTVDLVRSLQNVKCVILYNHLFDPDSVHGLLGNFAINL